MASFSFSSKGFDWSLLIVVSVLVLIGLSVIYSVALSQNTPDYSLLYKQVGFFVAGLILVFSFAYFDYRLLGTISWIFYIFSILLLIGVLFFGVTIKGTTGWYRLFGLGFQPVEVVKLSVLLVLARYLAGSNYRSLSFGRIVVSFLIVLLPVLLVMLQPDLGSALVLLFSWLMLVWFSGIPRKFLFSLVVILLLVSVVSWFFVLADYQKERVMTFADPERDPLGDGYNVRQSIIAIGSGQMFGRGLGLGTQSQLHFLPETEADFIFASLSEELGFVGSGLVIVLYFMLFWRIKKITSRLRDNYSSLLILGIASIFFVQICINIGMSLGLLPVTGLPLPFISSGGSFLIISFVFVGIIQSISLRNTV